ncbi:response regulator [Vibrio sp. WXL210]|uniref:response regulator n=1 Tax=Vibrio sp. WXL210 TaxID=3450709 RepID=UPI003EC8388A
MTSILGWLNNYSVKTKLLIGLSLPLLLVIFLATRQISVLDKQLTSLQTIESGVNFIENLSTIYKATHQERINQETAQLERAFGDLQGLIPNTFPSQEQILVRELVADLKETGRSIRVSTDPEEITELSDWMADIYKQLVLMLEKEPIHSGLSTVEGHQQALYQLEWLLFWASEENWHTHMLIDDVSNSEISDILSEPYHHDMLLAYLEKQQLYIERFVAINADEEQVKLLLTTFSNQAFIKSNDFRQRLLDTRATTPISDSELRQGFVALDRRLNLLSGVASAIEEQLKGEISQLVADFNTQRNLFLSSIGFVTLIVLVIGISLAHRITSKLKYILSSLEQIERSPDADIEVKVPGADELSKFAAKVDHLAKERIDNQKRIISAKEEAESAKDKAILASKAKSSFLANMSHEIRTPLNGVIGISEILADTELSATQRDYVDTIETSSQLLLSLINDILDFSKIESGMLQIAHHHTTIRETLFDIASILAPKTAEKEITLNVDIDPNLPYRIMIDDHRLRQVLMNFMSNAVKFTETGGVTIGAKVNGMDGKLAMIEFEVIDSGIGIDEKKQATIFEPFAQEDDSTTRQFGGTGLGLAISTQLIELMGGQIKLDSRKGHGSRFYFELGLEVIDQTYSPAVEQSKLQVVLVSQDANMTEGLVQEFQYYDVDVLKVYKNTAAVSDLHDNCVVVLCQSELNQTLADCKSLRERFAQPKICLVRRYGQSQHDYGNLIDGLVSYPLLGNRLIKAVRICSTATPSAYTVATTTDTKPEIAITKALLIEDNKVNQKVAQLALRKMGYECDIANNGQEAVDMVKANPAYLFALMDCMMPVLDGFEATKQIRAWEQNNGHKKLPIIAMTASVVDDDIQYCFECGMDDYVPKPFKSDLLRDKIERLITEEPNLVVQSKSEPASATPEAPVPSANQSTGPSKEPEKILLVEDNKVNQKVAGTHLKNAGYQYDIANDGQEAVDLIEAGNKYQLILMDCMMPNKDGFTATSEIRLLENEFGFERTPIVALTASVVDDDIKRCFDMGMDAYLAKPIKKDILIDKITRLTH